MCVEFDDGEYMYFPQEAIATQLERWDTLDERRHGVIKELHRMVERMGEEENFDIFDMIALGPDQLHGPFSSNFTKATIRVFIQLLVPILLSAPYYIEQYSQINISVLLNGITYATFAMLGPAHGCS